MDNAEDGISWYSVFSNSFSLTFFFHVAGIRMASRILIHLLKSLGLRLNLCLAKFQFKKMDVVVSTLMRSLT